MLRVKFISSILLLLSISINAIDSRYKFEGVLGYPLENFKNCNSVSGFLPYNPVIVEIGAYEGEGTLELAVLYPRGRIFAFEAHPIAYAQLAKNARSLKNVVTVNLAINTFNGTANLWGNNTEASLLPLDKKAGRTKVPCILLEDWCRNNNIDHIDFLRVDAGGFEWQILQSSPKILNTVLVIVIKSHLFPSRQSIISFPLVKKLLEDQGFELLSHWYEEEKEGEAIFVRKYMYDSIFR